jgi:hypothetical protein
VNADVDAIKLERSTGVFPRFMTPKCPLYRTTALTAIKTR